MAGSGDLRVEKNESMGVEIVKTTCLQLLMVIFVAVVLMFLAQKPPRERNP